MLIFGFFLFVGVRDDKLRVAVGMGGKIKDLYEDEKRHIAEMVQFFPGVGLAPRPVVSEERCP